MLVIEHQSNGQRVVKLKKDWHPSMMCKAYTPPRRNYVDSDEMRFVQSGLLKRSKK
jgi:hypothetical protein